MCRLVCLPMYCLILSWGLAGIVQGAEPLPPAEAPGIESLGAEASQAIGRCFDYDITIPLESRVVERIKNENLFREKIVFRGVQGFLVPAYLQLPPAGAGSFPCVLLMHGWSGSKEDWWRDDNYISGGNLRRALLAAGFAVMAIDAQCHGDRIAQNDFAPVNHYVDVSAGSNPHKGYFARTDIYVQTVRDARRAIDYLAARQELDPRRIGVVGYSMGGTQTFLLTGVEPRVRASVAVATPAEKSKYSILAPQNFVRRHRRSALFDDSRSRRRDVLRRARPRRASSLVRRRQRANISRWRSQVACRLCGPCG